jgi:hypothetical protein
MKQGKMKRGLQTDQSIIQNESEHLCEISKRSAKFRARHFRQRFQTGRQSTATCSTGSKLLQWFKRLNQHMVHKNGKCDGMNEWQM